MRRGARFFALIILVVVLAVSICLYLSDNGYFDSGTRASVTLDASVENIIERADGGLVLYSASKLSRYDASLRLIWEKDVPFGGATVLTNENYTLLYKDKDLALYKDDEQKAVIKTQNDINSAAVNKNGYITVVSDETGYRGKCVVYNQKGEEVFRYFSGENYIASAKLSPNNLTLCVNMLFLGGADAVSIVSFIDINTGETINEHAFTDNLIADIEYVGNNQALALGDKYLLSFSGKGEERWRYDYDGQSPEKIKACDGVIAVLSQPEGGIGRSVLNTFDYAGRKKGTYYPDGIIEYMDTSGGYVSVTSGQDITMLNKKGEIVGTSLTASPITDILLYENKNRVALLSYGYLRTEKFDR